MASGRCFRVNWAEGKAMKNRLWKIMALLGFLVVGGSGRGEVVFSSNTSASNVQSITGNTSSTSAYSMRTNGGVFNPSASVLFTANGVGSTYNLSAATMRFLSNQNSSTSFTLQFQLYNYASGSIGSLIQSSDVSTTYSGAAVENNTFNLSSAFAGKDLLGGSQYLLVMYLSASGFPSGRDLSLSTSIATWSTGGTTTPWTLQTGSVNKNDGTTPTAFTVGGTQFAFALETTAVPEPGTLILGGIAAVSGGAGVWWKRRRKKATDQSEAPEETPVV